MWSFYDVWCLFGVVFLCCVVSFRGGLSILSDVFWGWSFCGMWCQVVFLCWVMSFWDGLSVVCDVNLHLNPAVLLSICIRVHTHRHTHTHTHTPTNLTPGLGITTSSCLFHTLHTNSQSMVVNISTPHEYNSKQHLSSLHIHRLDKWHHQLTHIWHINSFGKNKHQSGLFNNFAVSKSLTAMH